MYQLTKQHKIQMFVILLVMSFMLHSCATTGGTGTGTQTMTDRQQGLMWMGVYNVEFDSAKLVLETSTATPAQRDLAMKKKVILTRAYPLIKDFTAPASSINPATGKKWTNAELLKYEGPIVGYSMSQDKLNMLLGLIDELTVLLLGGG